MDLDCITFISCQEEDVEFKKELIKSCLSFTEEAFGEGLVTQATTETLKIFRNLLEAHNYDPLKVEVILPVKSNDLKEHCDSKTYSVLKDLNVEQLKELLDLAELFSCDMLRMSSLMAVQCLFYVGNDKKAAIEKFKQDNGIEEDFTEEEENEILKENELVLQEILQTYDTTNPKYKPKQFDQDEYDDEEEYEELEKQMQNHSIQDKK